MSEEQVVRALVKQVETDPVGVFGEIGSWDYMTANERKGVPRHRQGHISRQISRSLRTRAYPARRPSNNWTFSKMPA